MSRKGRRGRARKRGANDASVDGVADRSQPTPSESSLPSGKAEASAAEAALVQMPGPTAPAAREGSSASDGPVASEAAALGVAGVLSDAPVVLSSVAEDGGPPSGPSLEEKTPPPTFLDLAGDAPVITKEEDFELLFFDEMPSDSWLAHELEMGDPRMIQKMTEAAVQRRAHFAKYVKGIVGAAAAICVIAAIKAAVPSGENDFVPAVVDQIPAAQPGPAVELGKADGGGGGW
jgi:hypothetical protein